MFGGRSAAYPDMQDARRHGLRQGVRSRGGVIWNVQPSPRSTRSALPISAVGLPASRSTMKRTPTPRRRQAGPGAGFGPCGWCGRCRRCRRGSGFGWAWGSPSGKVARGSRGCPGRHSRPGRLCRNRPVWAGMFTAREDCGIRCRRGEGGGVGPRSVAGLDPRIAQERSGHRGWASRQGEKVTRS